MNKFKKAISVGMSAALLASLMATIAAPVASASITGTSAGNVAQGSTSVGTASYLFTENSIAALPNAAGSMTVTITPAAPGVGTVTWSGTPVVSAPSSLGATASVAGNVLTINVAASDPANVETISISGLKVAASSTASPGAVVATLSAGLIGTAFSGGTVTATGKLAQAYGIGTTVFAVANDLGSCPFSGTNNVTVGTEVLTGTTVSGPGVPVAGQQTFTTAAMTNNHLANEVVSQTVPNCNILVLSSPATVVQALAYTSHGIPTVFPGENNSPAASVDLVEPAAGFLAVGNVITFTIDTAGVVFSNVPAAPTLFAGDIVLGAPVLAADRKSVSLTVTTASTVASGIHFFGTLLTSQGILYDVAATVPAGTFISLTATATGKIVLPASDQNAIVFRGVVASAPSPRSTSVRTTSPPAWSPSRSRPPASSGRCRHRAEQRPVGSARRASTTPSPSPRGRASSVALPPETSSCGTAMRHRPQHRDGHAFGRWLLPVVRLDRQHHRLDDRDRRCA